MQISWHLSFANRYNYMKEWAAHTLKRSWEEAWGKVEKFYSKAAWVLQQKLSWKKSQQPNGNSRILDLNFCSTYWIPKIFGEISKLSPWLASENRLPSEGASRRQLSWLIPRLGATKYGPSDTGDLSSTQPVPALPVSAQAAKPHRPSSDVTGSWKLLLPSEQIQRYPNLCLPPQFSPMILITTWPWAYSGGSWLFFYFSRRFPLHCWVCTPAKKLSANHDTKEWY